jgi:succinyl-CoA synthetase alpha subunit
MSRFVDASTKVLVQGLGKVGQFHTDKAIAYGTKMVGRSTPAAAAATTASRGDRPERGAGPPERYEVDLPVFDTVRDAVAATGADASVIYVPPAGAADAIMEAAEAGIPSSSASPRASRSRTWCAPSATSRPRDAPDRPELPRRHHAARSARSASCPATSTWPGRVGVVSRSGTLTYEAVKQLTDVGLGQTTASASAATRQRHQLRRRAASSRPTRRRRPSS